MPPNERGVLAGWWPELAQQQAQQQGQQAAR